MRVPFNRPYFSPRETQLLMNALSSGSTSGNGPMGSEAERILSDIHGGMRTLLTTSCSHALEMAADLLDLTSGDEVIVPSYAFVTTASSFARRGATVKFADVEPTTLNMDPASVQSLISERTRAIVTLHYGGIGSSVVELKALADSHGCTLVEDNAHGLGGGYAGKTLGTFGAMSTLSFHETKNITSGEGGALVLSDPSLVERAEILREKGTNRSSFLRGTVDKYTWVDVGSSWVQSDLLAALLVGQLERYTEIQARRQHIWNTYFDVLTGWCGEQGFSLPVVPLEAMHTAHLFYLQAPTSDVRDSFIEHMNNHGVGAVFHYQPLHLSPVGRAIGGRPGQCPVSESAAGRIVRLPIFFDMTPRELDYVTEMIRSFSI